MNTIAYYQKIDTFNSNLEGSIARKERAFESSDGSWVWLISLEPADDGPQAGKAGRACMVVVRDRTGIPRAARAIVDGGFRLSVEADFQEGGAVFESLRQQQAALAARKLADEKLEGRNKSFLVKIPGSEA